MAGNSANSQTDEDDLAKQRTVKRGSKKIKKEILEKAGNMGSKAWMESPPSGGRKTAPLLPEERGRRD